MEQGAVFPFDLGKAFPNLLAYLTLKDKVALCATCRLLHELLLKGHFWESLEITDYEMEREWSQFVQWCNKFIRIIQPPNLSITLLRQEHNDDPFLKELLIQSQPWVR